VLNTELQHNLTAHAIAMPKAISDHGEVALYAQNLRHKRTPKPMSLL